MEKVASGLALVIDAENIGAQHIDAIIAFAASKGGINIRRVYGDFTLPNLKPWLAAAARHGLIVRHVPSEIAGKNSADIQMVIDAMDLVHQTDVDSFVIATSDSDFTGLILRLRESGRAVYAIGNANAPVGLRSGVLQFHALENGGHQKNAIPPTIKGLQSENSAKSASPVSKSLNEAQKRIEAILLLQSPRRAAWKFSKSTRSYSVNIRGLEQKNMAAPI